MSATDPTGILDPDTNNAIFPNTEDADARHRATSRQDIDANVARWKTYLERIDIWVPKDMPDDMFEGHLEGCAWVREAQTQHAFAFLNFVLTNTADDMLRALARGDLGLDCKFADCSRPDFMVGFFHGAATILSQDIANCGGRLA